MKWFYSNMIDCIQKFILLWCVMFSKYFAIFLVTNSRLSSDISLMFFISQTSLKIFILFVAALKQQPLWCSCLFSRKHLLKFSALSFPSHRVTSHHYEMKENYLQLNQNICYFSNTKWFIKFFCIASCDVWLPFCYACHG